MFLYAGSAFNKPGAVDSLLKINSILDGPICVVLVGSIRTPMLIRGKLERTENQPNAF